MNPFSDLPHHLTLNGPGSLFAWSMDNSHMHVHSLSNHPFCNVIVAFSDLLDVVG